MEPFWFFRLWFHQAYDSAYDSDFPFWQGRKHSDSVASEIIFYERSYNRNLCIIVHHFGYTGSYIFWIFFKNANKEKIVSFNYLLMKSRAWALSCVALCMSANISMSHTLSTVRFEHNASSHITLSLSRSYCKKGS